MNVTSEITPEELMRERIAKILSEQLYYIKNDPTIDIQRTTEEAIQSMLSTFPDSGEKSSYFWRPTQLGELAYQLAKDRFENPGLPGFDTGFPILNDMLGGFERKNIYVINARPGAGKTTLLLQLAWQLASQTNIVFFSPEARADMLSTRLAAALSGVPMEPLRRGYISARQLEAIKKAGDIIKTRPLFIFDLPELNTEEMNRIIDRVEKQTGKPVGAIGLDYLQQMEGRDDFGDITQNMKKLETLTVKRKVTCIMASQVGRASGDGTDLDAGKGSGKIEELATAILGFRRLEEEYRSMLVCSKNRHEGKMFKLVLKYNKMTGFFDEESLQHD